LKENSSFKIFVQEKLGAKKVYAKDSEIENLEVNILIQNFKKKTKRRKSLGQKLTQESWKKEKVEKWSKEPQYLWCVAPWPTSLGP